MELLTYIHKLRFNIDNDTPPEYMKRWKEFKLNCENGDNQNIVEQIKDNCTLKQNKLLPYLNRSEGGLGGDNNEINKQIRFRDKKWSKIPRYKDNYIYLDEIINTETEKWTYEELDDIILAFIKTANYIVQSECVNGCIELENVKSYSDYYLY